MQHCGLGPPGDSSKSALLILPGSLQRGVPSRNQHGSDLPLVPARMPWVLVSPSDKPKCCELFPWLRHSSHPGPAVPTSKLSLIHNHTPVHPYLISAPPQRVPGYFGFQGSLSLPSAPFHLIDRHSLPLLPCRVPTPIYKTPGIIENRARQESHEQLDSQVLVAKYDPYSTIVHILEKLSCGVPIAHSRLTTHPLHYMGVI